MLLNAVMCVWNEEDIIESTVKHAFAQGCSQVFFIDNASTDKTVENAIHAGAVQADSFESKYFEETQKISHLNSVVKKYNEQSAEEHIWWLFIDADEFPNIDRNVRIIDFIKALDSSVRLVHGHMFDHVPTHPPYHVPGYHPADFMPIAAKSPTSKIPLIRYDKGKQHLYSCGGAHSLDTAGESLPIIKDLLDIHHFPYRRPEHSLARLKLLVKKNADGSSRVDWCDELAQRLQKSPDARSDYHDRYEKLQAVYHQNRYAAFLHENTPYQYKDLTRWYDSVAPMRLDGCSPYEQALGQAVHHFFLGEFDRAFCSFDAAFALCRDERETLFLCGKMASCLAKSNRVEAIRLLTQMQHCQFPDVKNYTEKLLRSLREDDAAKKGGGAGDQSMHYTIVRYFGKYEEHLFA
jgi:glycosyltransferase involved in cell wall biosynthesis